MDSLSTADNSDVALENARSVFDRSNPDIPMNRREIVWQATLAVYDIVTKHVFNKSQILLDFFAMDVLALARGIRLKENSSPHFPYEVVFPEPTEDHPVFHCRETKVAAALIWALVHREEGLAIRNEAGESPKMVIRFDIDPATLAFVDIDGGIGVTDTYVGERNMKDYVFRLAEHPEFTRCLETLARQDANLLEPAVNDHRTKVRWLCVCRLRRQSGWLNYFRSLSKRDG